MKKLYFILLAVIISSTVAQGQKVISNGFPGVGILDGVNYKRTKTIGNVNYSFVAATDKHAVASGPWTEKLYFVDLATEAISDSLAVATGDLEIDGDTLMACRGGHMYRINLATKAVIDSVKVTKSTYRIELRPGVKEAWISDSTNIYVVDYASTMSVSSFVAGVDKYDNGPIRFTKGGSVAYKVAPLTHRVYKIDAANKTLVDSVNLPGGNNSGIEISSDSSKLFVSNPNDFKIYVVKTSDMSLMDSIASPREPFEMFRHPTRAEIWCVNHFDDSVTVYKESDYSEIAAIDLPSGPHIIAFAAVPVGVKDISRATIDAMLFPNPAKDQLTISMPIGGKYTVSLLDNTGKTIHVLNTIEPIVRMPVSNMAAGNYFVHIQNEHGVASTLQWIKQ